MYAAHQAALLLAVVNSASALNARPDAAPKALRSAPGFISPLKFKQQLLVCNAYPSNLPVEVQKNGKESLASGKDALAFQECRYVSSHVQKFDRLEFGLQSSEENGIFEVGSLPSADSVLLLVLERRNASKTMSFQSFAFATLADAKDAQLAVIDAMTDSNVPARLEMEDHIVAKGKDPVTKRAEQLYFNRVYSVGEGNYDAFVKHDNSSALEGGRKAVSFAKSTNYVVLRTGGGDFPENLIVFPQKPPRVFRDGSSRAACAWMTFLSMVLLANFAGC